MVEDLRGDQLFMQADEMSKLKTLLSDHGLKNGLRDLIDISEKIGKEKDTVVEYFLASSCYCFIDSYYFYCRLLYI